MLSEADLQNWVGREQTLDDTATRAPLDGLASLLDCPAFEGSLPSLAQWLYFLPRTRQSHLSADGHPLGGEFLPPMPYPRRMWAGGSVQFEHDIAIGAEMSRLTRIASIEEKAGRSGPMFFITLLHEISVNRVLAIRETQNLVYRPKLVNALSDVASSKAPVPSNYIADCEEIRTVDCIALFRFSALTFNAHRIHYDRDFARDIEGYPGLVVHGPFLATLLMRFFRQSFPTVRPTVFRYRLVRPLFDLQPFKLLGASSPEKVKLWITDQKGHLVMDAEASMT